MAVTAWNGNWLELGERCSAVLVRALACIFLVVLVWLVTGPAAAQQSLEPIEVDGTAKRIELFKAKSFVQKSGQSLQVETAPSLDGMTGRMSVRASLSGSQPDWMVFALRNTADRPITLWVVSERYTLIGSGISFPDLDARRIEAVTPSIGFVPERVPSDRADIFQLTVDPGKTITYAVELAAERVAHVDLWQPTAYRLKVRERQLFNGIMLGIAGVLGVFLTAVFAANHKLIFPAAALVAWSVLAYLCVDFGFWHKLFQLNAEDNAVYRAATEAAIAASLAMFLYAFLKIGAWGGFIRMIFGVWIIAQVALVALATIDPRLSAGFARMSFALLGGFGGTLILFLAARGQDRALALLSIWILLGVWAFGTSMALNGELSGDLVVSAIVAGLVIIIVLLGFTVTQFAFSNIQQAHGAATEDQAARSLAVDGAGAAVWEWHARRDEVSVSPIIDAQLGLDAGSLSAQLDSFAKHLHAADQERFLAALGSVKEKNGGTIRIDFRMRHSENFYRWFNLEAASIPTTDRRALRCCGLIRDITDERRTQDLLMFDAVHDSVTGLPNRNLFLDRLGRDIVHARQGTSPLPPTVLLIDIDKFRNVNSTYGIVVGDSLLLTVARRLKGLLGPCDTIARIGGNQFGLILHETDFAQLHQLADKIRLAVGTPIQIGGHDIILTGATGAAQVELTQDDPRQALSDAEIAMYRAKRSGLDQFELFRPEMRSEVDDHSQLSMDLKAAVENGQLVVFYQPIVYLPNENLAGFEALVRWQHPERGMLNPTDFISIAEESDLINQLGAFVLRSAALEAAKWQRALPRDEGPLFVSVNISSRQLLTSELVQEVRRILSDVALPRDGLRLELTETLVMENPERANRMLRELRDAGARLAIDDFGTGYSSLAYLQRFPFETIKIDRELVQLSSDDQEGSAIVRSIVALAHELGKQIVAEGVETPEDVTFLRSIGCEYGQGFYYGEAMSARDVMDLLKVVRKAERKFKNRIFKPKPIAAEDRPQIAADTATDGDLNASGDRLRTNQKTASATPAKARKAKKSRKPVAANGSAPAPVPGSVPPGSVPRTTPASVSDPAHNDAQGSIPSAAPEVPAARTPESVASVSAAVAGLLADPVSQQQGTAAGAFSNGAATPPPVPKSQAPGTAADVARTNPLVDSVDLKFESSAPAVAAGNGVQPQSLPPTTAVQSDLESALGDAVALPSRLANGHDGPPPLRPEQTADHSVSVSPPPAGTQPSVTTPPPITDSVAHASRSPVTLQENVDDSRDLIAKLQILDEPETAASTGNSGDIEPSAPPPLPPSVAPLVGNGDNVGSIRGDGPVGAEAEALPAVESAAMPDAVPAVIADEVADAVPAALTNGSAQPAVPTQLDHDMNELAARLNDVTQPPPLAPGLSSDDSMSSEQTPPQPTEVSAPTEAAEPVVAADEAGAAASDPTSQDITSGDVNPVTHGGDETEQIAAEQLKTLPPGLARSLAKLAGVGASADNGVDALGDDPGHAPLGGDEGSDLLKRFQSTSR